MFNLAKEPESALYLVFAYKLMFCNFTTFLIGSVHPLGSTMWPKEYALE